MRCPDCNKFVSYDEPEIETGQIEEQSEGRVTCPFTVTLCCGECGTDLKQASDVEAEGQLDMDVTHTIENCPYEFTESSVEADTKVEGHGRGAKTFYGCRIVVEVECECGAADGTEIELLGHVHASEMDEVA